MSIFSFNYNNSNPSFNLNITINGSLGTAMIGWEYSDDSGYKVSGYCNLNFTVTATETPNSQQHGRISVADNTPYFIEYNIDFSNEQLGLICGIKDIQSSFDVGLPPIDPMVWPKTGLPAPHNLIMIPLSPPS